MEPFATVEDLEARWRTLTDKEKVIANTELLDTTAFIQAQLNKYHVSVDAADEVQAQNLIAVTCSVSRRSLAPRFQAEANGSSDAISAPVTQQTVSAGVFSQTHLFANPMGDKYLTASEKRLLGIGRVVVGSARAAMCDLWKMEGRDATGEWRTGSPRTS